MARYASELMIDRTARLFEPLGRVAVSARAGSGAERRARELGLTVLYDDPSAEPGPLAGVLAGLEWAQREGFGLLATAPCDAPLLPLDLAERLISALGDAPAVYAVTDKGEHPLCGVWSTALADTLARRLRRGEHPAVRAHLAEAGAVTVHFADTGAFANANTIADLAALEQHA